MLVRLLYASRAAGTLTPEAIEAIVEQSRRHNPAHGITGILCYSGEIFMQVLEGGRDAVCELYNNIARDERHRNVRLLSYEEIGVRRFSSWTMGQVNLARINPAVLLKHSERPTLDPFSCTGAASLALLDELIATASVLN
ncbi:MAG: BLUF domain-containing protein [Candidatus Dactylopiibacterium sp.]|nr:BLUF domain-containing protein [Candidatus Dactylopiibacterium sp.]